ncbi:MAG TPA: hypothetical protein PLS25_07930 [Methanoregulaceae archaeon]|nr:hypothetical protein [Methanoregulaceae archaeon]
MSKLIELFQDAGWTKAKIYHWTRRHDNPLPHKKNGKCLEFDLEKVYRWWDELPGKDQT